MYYSIVNVYSLSYITISLDRLHRSAPLTLLATQTVLLDRFYYSGEALIQEKCMRCPAAEPT